MSLFAFRRSAEQDELSQLANKHAETDLEPADRETLRKATKRVATASTVGSFVGLALGIYGSIRLRRLRTDTFVAFRAAERPMAVVFPNGKHMPIPDNVHLMRPTRLGDFASHFFFGLAGLFFGGELGLLGGTVSATRTLNRDPAGRERIERAYRLLKVDILRKEAARLESGGTPRLI